MINLKTLSKNYLGVTAIFLSAMTVSISITVAQILLGIAIIWLIVYLIVNKVNIAKDCPYFIPFLIYFFTTIFGYFFGSEFANAKSNISHIWTILFLFIGYYLVKENHIRLILFAFVLGGTALAVSAIGDVVIRGAPRGNGFLSIYMTTGNNIALATTLAFGMIISKYETFRMRIVYAVAIIIMIIGIGFTGVRGAFLAFAVAMIAGFIIRFKLRGVLFSIGLVVVLAVSIMLSDVSSSRFIDLMNGSTDYTTSHGWRLLLWENSFKVFLQYPIFGVGGGAYNSLLSAVMPHIEGMSTGHAHNSYIEQLVLYGIVGFAGFLYFLGKVVYHLSRKALLNRYSFIGFLLSITFLIEGLTEDNFRDSEVIMFFSLLSGVLLMAINKGIKDKVQH